MDHPFIREVRNDQKKVLCVITGVSVLDNGGTLQRCSNEAKSSINLSVSCYKTGTTTCLKIGITII